MRRAVVATLGLAVAVLAAPSVSHGQLPAGDSVMVSGSALGPPPSAGANFIFDQLDIRAVSGPSGENPSGRVSFFLVSPGAGTFVGSLTADNVNCLAVNGNRAVIGFRDEIFIREQWAVEVVDNGPPNSGLDTFAAFLQLTPGDCPPPSLEPKTVNPGDVVVRDVQPFPTSKEQCKNGGWRNFPGFKNQGDCVSFVATGGRNRPPSSG
jgi:hypothetical protein